MVHTEFNWCWYHVPTFAAYKVEGTFFPLVLAQGNTTQSAKSAAIVLQSLTPNAQSVFKVLAEYQMSHPDEEGIVVCVCGWHLHVYFIIVGGISAYVFHYICTSGMPLNDLYTSCRERFLLSSQVTLNAHLTEFKDHELVKTRRHSDGQDCLYIPLTSEALEKLVLEISQ